MSSSKENNDYPQDDNFKRFGSLLSPFKKKGKKNKNNVTVKESEIPKTEEDIQVDNVSMITYKEPIERNLQCKSEVYEEMVLLIYQNELNLTERSYKLKHLKDAFNISDDKHKEILDKVAHKPSEHKEEEVQHDDSSSSGSKFYNLPEEINIHHLEEHSELLQTFLEYDLRFLNIQRYHWNGEYCEMVQKLLSLHAKDRGLNEMHVLHAKWIAYTKIHENHPISLNSFLELLNSLTDPLVLLELNQQHDNISLKTKQAKIGFRRPTISDLLNIVSFGSENATCGITETDASENGKCKLKYVQSDVVSAFWNSTENLVEFFSKFIRNLHLVSSDEEKVSNVDILKEAFSIFDKIESICMPANEQPINFRESVKESLSRGVSEHLAKNANQSVLSLGNKNDSRIEELIRLIKLSQSYLLKFTSEYKDTFESYLNVDFPEHMYRNYDKELMIIIKPIVLNICESEDGNIEEFATNHKPVAKNLFELYRELKKFADYGVEKFVRCNYEMSDYYSWFLAPISKCRKISVFSILPRLETAVKEDNLRPDKEEINVSSSANDLLVLLHDIKKFWEYLQMTGSKEDYTKFIVGDFYRFTTKYFEQFVTKIENSLDLNDFDKVALTLSVALANHNYVKEKMIQLQTDLTRGDEYDVSNVQSIIRYTVKYIETAITQLMIAVTKKYYTSIRGKIEADSNGNENSESIEMEVTCESVGYVEKILSIVPESASCEFETLKSALWQNIYEITNEMIKHANHPPLFYSKLHIVFSKLKNIFFGENIQPETKENIENIEYYLECYEYKLSRLIHEYYKERFVKQQIIPQEVANSLTVNTFISDNVLTLKIIGTNELFKSNKKVEPQLTIKIIPENYFQNYQNIRLRLSQDAFDPIKIQLTKEQRHMKDAIIYFKIETRNLVRSRSLFAEAFLSFENIPVHDFKKSIEDINLMLNKLTTEDLETLEAIRKESDKGDKEAKKFLERIKLQI